MVCSDFEVIHFVNYSIVLLFHSGEFFLFLKISSMAGQKAHGQIRILKTNIS